MGGMKDSEIYLRAAESVASKNNWSCNEVDIAAGYVAGSESPQAKIYSDMFASRDANTDPPGEGYLWAADVRLIDECTSKEWRVLALCFMAAIAKSEGR